MTDVKTPYSSVPVTTSVAADATVTDSGTVNIAASASCFAPFVDIPMLNMLPHVIAEGMAPNIQVTIHSKVVHMMLDSGAQVSVLPSELAGEFDPPVPLPSRGVGDHGVQSGGSGYQSLPG